MKNKPRTLRKNNKDLKQDTRTYKMRGKLLIYDSYLKMIKNSVGTKMFRNLYLEINGDKADVAKNGNFSCAFFVSNILKIWGLISEGHANVPSTTKDMIKNGWKKIPKDKAKPGDVIVWEKRKGSDGLMHYHNGFYIGNGKAISNDDKKRTPVIHKWDYKKITTIYTHPKLKA
jgi:hypothetical protein